MRILLCYSLVHYDPNLSEKEHLFWGSSTNILARSLFQILSELGDITYIDERAIGQYKGQYFDIIIGTIGSFKKLTDLVKANTKILFNVQMHPVERILLFLRFVNNNGLSKFNVINWGEIVEVQKTYFAIKKADYLLGVGNTKTQDSFVKFGVNINKIKLLNYGLLHEISVAEPYLKTFPIVNLLYFATDIGLRKGFDIIYNLFESNLIPEKNFVLHIVGNVSKEFYLDKINLLSKKLGERFIFHGWINSNSIKYIEVLRRMDVLIYPSLEEGQAGTVIDCISRGIIPILSKNCGIDFSPIGFFELELNNRNNFGLIKTILQKSENELSQLRNLTIQYYEEFHANFYEVLKKTIIETINNKPYPKFSIILPISKDQFNSKSMLKSFWRALEKYQNVEVFFLFENDVNFSKEIILNNFKDKKLPFEIHLHKFSEISVTESINIILKRSTGKYCLINHNEIIFENENVLYDYAYFLDKNESAAVLGISKTYKNVNSEKFEYRQVVYDEELKNKSKFKRAKFKNAFIEVDSFIGKSIIIRRSILASMNFLVIGGNMESAYFDLCLKASALGHRIYCNYLIDASTQKSVAINKADSKDWLNNSFTDLNNSSNNGIKCLKILTINSSGTKTNILFAFIEFIHLAFMPFWYSFLKKLKI
jgi:hypothetical protein